MSTLGRLSARAARGPLSTAGRLNGASVAIVAVLALVLVPLLARNSYQAYLAQAVDAASKRLLNRAELDWLFYRTDRAGLQRAVDALVASPEVASARAFSRIGEELAAAGDRRVAAFTALRAGASTTETAIRGRNAAGETSDTGYFSTLIDDTHRVHLSLPVISALNPADPKLTAFDFLNAATRPGEGQSDFVVGYVHLALDSGYLRAASFMPVRQTLLQWLAPLLLSLGAMLWWNRRVLANFRGLVAAMDRVAEGDFETAMELEGGSEFTELSAALTRLSDGLGRYRQEIELGRELLSRKVEERNSQLSQSHEQLSRATEAASERERRLQELTYYDALTSLPNRRLFTEQFEQVMSASRHADQSTALLLIDLNNFRRINDTLGHHAGDLLLREVAKRLRHSVRGSDIIIRLGEQEHNIAVSRLGGDEFTVVLHQLDKPEAADAVAQRIIRRLSQPMAFEDQQLTVTPAIGIALYPGDGDSAAQLLSAAAAATRTAKRASGDGYLFFQPAMVSDQGQQLQLETDLRDALEREQLLLHFQPQIDTVMGSVVAIEALLRWQHPERGLLPPGEFMPLAETAGLMPRIGDWVLREACQRLKQLEGKVAELPRVAVNISVRQFSGGLVNAVRAALAQSGLAADRLELSLSEKVLNLDEKALLATARALRELGVYLSLDGYGLGSGCLARISELPLDELKIEPDFLVRCRQRQPGPLLALIATATHLGLRPVAGGVETEADYRFLADHGVKHMQGRLYSAPVPPNELMPLLAPWHFSEHIRRLATTVGA